MRGEEEEEKKDEKYRTAKEAQHRKEGVNQPTNLGIPVERIRGIIIRLGEGGGGLPFIMPNTRETSALSDAAGSSNPTQAAK